MRRSIPKQATAAILSLCALSALSACGEGGVVDQNVKAELRTQLISTCTSTAEGQVPEGLDVDLNNVCECATDKMMAGKSVKELISNPPTSAEDLAPIKECLKEAGPVKIAPAPEG